MEQGRFARFAPLTGVVFFALIVLAVIVSNGETPDADATPRAIASYYNDNGDKTMVADLIGTIAAAFLVWFAASLRAVIWAAEGGAGRLASLVLGGGLLSAAGAWVVFGIDFALADVADDVPATSMQTLNALNNAFFLPLAGGWGVFMLASGFAIVRTRALPVVAGWLALVLGVITFTPIGFFGLLAGLVWVAVVSVMLYRKGEGPVAGERATSPVITPTA